MREGGPETALVTGSVALVAAVYFSRVVHPNYLIPAAVLLPVGVLARRLRADLALVPLLLFALAVEIAERQVFRRHLGPGRGRRPAEPPRRPRRGPRPPGGLHLTQDPLGLLFSAVAGGPGDPVPDPGRGRHRPPRPHSRPWGSPGCWWWRCHSWSWSGWETGPASSGPRTRSWCSRRGREAAGLVQAAPTPRPPRTPPAGGRSTPPASVSSPPVEIRPDRPQHAAGPARSSPPWVAPSAAAILRLGACSPWLLTGVFVVRRGKGAGGIAALAPGSPAGTPGPGHRPRLGGRRPRARSRGRLGARASRALGGLLGCRGGPRRGAAITAPYSWCRASAPSGEGGRASSADAGGRPSSAAASPTRAVVVPVALLDLRGFRGRLLARSSSPRTRPRGLQPLRLLRRRGLGVAPGSSPRWCRRWRGSSPRFSSAGVGPARPGGSWRPSRGSPSPRRSRPTRWRCPSSSSVSRPRWALRAAAPRPGDEEPEGP